MASDGDVTQLLEEETKEEEEFRLHSQLSHQLHPAATIGLVHSPTTDTLDSVLLETSAADPDPGGIDQCPVEKDLLSEGHEEEVKEEEEDQINLDQVELNLTESEGEVPSSANEDMENILQNRPDPFLSEIADSFAGNVESSQASQDAPQPSISSYFSSHPGGSNSAAKFFDTFNDSADSESASMFKENASETVETSNSIDISATTGQMLELNLGESPSTGVTQNDDSTKVLVSGEATSPLEHSNTDVTGESDFPESVMFDMDLPESIEAVAEPVQVDEEEDFESFTADLAETEAMDALGMSPAAQSFLTDRHLQDYFRQTSQTDSLPSLDFQRQTSVNSTQSDHISDIAQTIASTEQTPVATPTPTPQSSIPPTPTHKASGSASESGTSSDQNTPKHQATFPPSTTLSPVDSPVHQPIPPVSDHKTTAVHEEGSVPAPLEIKMTDAASVLRSPEVKPELVSAFQTFPDMGSADDPFAATFEMSDTDRSHDAWIPSDNTQNTLIAMATSTAGTFLPSAEQLCRPMLTVNKPQGDPVRDLVYRYMGEQEALKRQVLTASNVSQDADGLKKLMEAGCLRSAVDLTGALLTAAGQGCEPSDEPVQHSPETLQIWYCRFVLMMRLRMYSVMESEMQAFQSMDTPDIYYEYYPHVYPGKRGSMVAFGMRLLHAELPHHMGRSQESLDRLYYMLAIVQKVIANLAEGLPEDGSAVTISEESRKVSQELWQEREKKVLYMVGNILLGIRDYDAALAVFEILLEKDSAHRLMLVSGMGRIHLQMGNLPVASEYFQQVRGKDKEKDCVTCIGQMNSGFEAMCQNNFMDAYESFKAAVQMEPTNTSAVNNMAVCCLYLGKLKEALTTLEALVHRDPDKNLHEGILFNLCTLYELESSRALHKKQALLDLVSKHKGDGFPVVCLKMA